MCIRDRGWASAKIMVAIGQNAAVTAGNCADDSTAPCYTVTESDTAWNVGEAVTITTQGCDNGDATCTVWITILNDRDGVTLADFNIAMEN